MRHHVIARTRRFASTAAATLAILTAAPVTLAQSGNQGGPPNGGQNGGQGSGQDGGRQGGEGQGGRRGGGQGGPGGGMRTGRGFGGGGGGMADIREQLEPDFIRRDVPVFVQQLQLDPTQGLVLETLMGDYEESYEAASTQVQTEIRDLGRQVFSSMVSPAMRERMMTVGQEVQEDLRRLSEERGAPLSEEERRTFFRERMQQIQQQMTAEAQAGGNAEMKRLMGDMFTRFEDWRVQKDTMRKDFVDGLKATLTDDQLALWPAFERFLTREKTLPRSRISGEGTNLILVLDNLELPPEAFEKVEPLLDSYEVRLDEALRARNDYLFQSTGKLFKALEQGDANDANRIIERQVEYRTAVRDVNDEYRTAFVSALGELPEAKALENAILAEAYERVYRPTNTRRAFDAALGMEGVDPGVHESIVALDQSYAVEISGLNRQLYETLRKDEPARTTRDAQRFVGMVTAAMNGDFSAMGMGGMGGMFGRGDEGPDPVREGFDKRETVEESYMERLKALLTPEQFEALPKPQRGGRGGGPGGGVTAMLDRLPADQKEAILKAADKNGNGQIDDDERGDAFRAMREIGGFGGGGRGGDQGGGQGAGQGGGRGQGGGGRGQGGGGGRDQGGNGGN